jgi:AcrR family transcriptional regulator
MWQYSVMKDPAASLRERRMAAARQHILDAAYELLVQHPEETFSHEAIAARAGVGARTVYRYFPSQADLYQEMWVRVREQAGTIFPGTEEQILPQVPILFGGFDRNEAVLTAILESPAGHRVRERGAPEGREAFSKALGKLTAGMKAARKRQVAAVFLAMYSAPFWELLRKRGGLSGTDAIAATEWAMHTLLEGLRQEGDAREIKGKQKTREKRK